MKKKLKTEIGYLRNIGTSREFVESVLGEEKGVWFERFVEICECLKLEVKERERVMDDERGDLTEELEVIEVSVIDRTHGRCCN